MASINYKYNIPYPSVKPNIKNTIPTTNAIMAIYLINILISFLKGDSPEFEFAASPAIWPITVFSPVCITTPFPVPSLQNVPKKAKFLVSKGFSAFVHSGYLIKSRDSPVKLELSTFIPLLSRILTSAGILFPFSIITISPGTNSFAYIF